MAKYTVVWRIEHNGAEMTPGSVVEGDLDHLLGKGLQELAEQPAVLPDQKPVDAMTKDELQELALSFGVNLDGRKSLEYLRAQVRELCIEAGE
jgi:hypothetical protein